MTTPSKTVVGPYLGSLAVLAAWVILALQIQRAAIYGTPVSEQALRIGVVTLSVVAGTLWLERRLLRRGTLLLAMAILALLGVVSQLGLMRLVGFDDITIQRSLWAAAAIATCVIVQQVASRRGVAAGAA